MTTLLFLVFLGTLLGGIARIVYTSIKEGSFKFLSSLPLFATSFFFLTLFLSFTTVDTGTRGIVTRFGQVNRTLEPGAHLVVPFTERVYPVSVQTLVVKPSETAASHDLQEVHTEVTLAYHFDPQYVSYIFSQLMDSSDNAVENKVINPTILEAIKARTAQYDAQQLISKRAEVRDGIETYIQERLKTYHIVPETVSITDFHFSAEFEKSIEAKVTAEQNAQKAQNDLNRIKIEAEQKVAAAEGEAQALRAQKEQVTAELLQLRTIEMMATKWDGKLPENYYGGNAPLPMMEVFKKK